MRRELCANHRFDLKGGMSKSHTNSVNYRVWIRLPVGTAYTQNEFRKLSIDLGLSQYCQQFMTNSQTTFAAT
jgi:hypothetical protein